MQHYTGSYAPAIGRFLKQVKNNEDITVCGDGKQTRDFVHVSDVVRAIILIKDKLNKDYRNQEKNIFDYFVVSTKTETKILNLAKLILKLSNNIKSKIIHTNPRVEPKKFVGDNSKLKSFID
jgi:UDP-glucose 4-epimerase